MTQVPLQWHPAFCSSLQIELAGEPLEFMNEYNLTRKPLQIDVLVIKKVAARTIQKSIGKLFRIHNIVEFKGPHDKLSINDYYKVLGYACIYQANTKTVMEVPPDEITMTFVINHYPRKLVRWLQKMYKSNVEQKYPGIYYLTGLPFPTQVIVIKRLSKAENKWLSRLRTDLKVVEDLNVLAEEYSEKQSDPLYATCMDVIVRANRGCYEKEGEVMCEAIRELMFEFMGDQLEAERAKMRKEFEVEHEKMRNEMEVERKKLEGEVRQEVAQEVRQEVEQEVRREVHEEVRVQTLIEQIRKKLKKNKSFIQIADELEWEVGFVSQICQVIESVSLEASNLDVFKKWKEMFAA